MRFPALLVPAVLLVGGAGYFFAKPKEDPSLASILARMDEPVRSSRANAISGFLDDSERAADDADADILAAVGRNKNLTEEQTVNAVNAAGRRFVRRRLAYNTVLQSASSAKLSPAELETLQKEIQSARRIYDLTESLGRLTNTARAEREMELRMRYAPSMIGGLADRHSGEHSTIGDDDLAKLQKAFETEFGKALPISANGASSVHRSLGFDHSGRVDVAVSPEGSEGIWLRRYLIGKGFSYFAFRRAMSGQSTGAHIHIGSASTRRVNY